MCLHSFIKNLCNINFFYKLKYKNTNVIKSKLWYPKHNELPGTPENSVQDGHNHREFFLIPMAGIYNS